MHLLAVARAEVLGRVHGEGADVHDDRRVDRPVADLEREGLGVREERRVVADGAQEAGRAEVDQDP